MFEENNGRAEAFGKHVGLGFAVLIFASIAYYLSGKFGWFFTKVPYESFILTVMVAYLIFALVRR